MSASVVIVGAGSGTRLGLATRKAQVLVHGRPLWWHAARAFAGIDAIAERILVVHGDDVSAVAGEPARSAGIDRVVAGGARRQDSVLAGVSATRADVRDVLVHDAARPLVRDERIRALLSVLETAEAALLAAPMVSTVKEADDCGRVVRTLDRTRLRAATTPQGGRRTRLLALLEAARDEGRDVTDEASLFEAAGIPPVLVEDDATNMKITTPADLQLFRSLLAPELPRVGHGYDVHRLVLGRPLVLGGVPLPSEVGLLGHSDGDALLHAVIEALLGAAGLPDIGEHFPDTDPRWKGADSTRLLAAVVAELAASGRRPAQIDATIIAERPRLGPHKAIIKERLSSLLGLPADRVAVKARTAEGLDAIGRGEALAVHVVAVVV